MKINQLTESEPLKIIEVSKRSEKPSFLDTSDSDFVETKLVKMIVFTDGILLSESAETIEEIEDYYFGKKKYECDVNTLKTKNIYLKNHSYVVTYLIAREHKVVDGIWHRWFNVVKDVSIYLSNLKDSKALKSARDVIKINALYNTSIDYSLSFEILFPSVKEKNNIESEEISRNVYSLRRK